MTELILSNTEADFTGNGLCYGGKFLKYFGGSRDKHSMKEVYLKKILAKLKLSQIIHQSIPFLGTKQNKFFFKLDESPKLNASFILSMSVQVLFCRKEYPASEVFRKTIIKFFTKIVGSSAIKMPFKISYGMINILKGKMKGVCD